MSGYLQLQESECWVCYDAVIKSSLSICRKHGHPEAQEPLPLTSSNPHFIARETFPRVSVKMTNTASLNFK